MVWAVDRVSSSRAGGTHLAVPAGLSSQRGQRVAYLDGIRALAIGGVLVDHWSGSRFPFGSGGYIGVDLFFVLSGYIISTMLWRSRPRSRSVTAQYRTFLWRRVVRLYPALLVMVLGTITIYALVPSGRARVRDLLAPGFVALVQGSTFSLARGHSSAFGMTWSLSIEWMFYLVWPLAIFVARRAGVCAKHAAPAVAVIAGVMYVVALFQSPSSFYFGPLARIPEMLIGGALALSVVDSTSFPPLRRPTVAMGIGLLLVAASAEYALFLPVRYGIVFRWIGLPLAVCTGLYLIWLGLRADNWLIKWLSCKPLILLGRASYSVYLWNFVGFDLFVRPGVYEPPMVIALAVAFGAGMAALSYRFIERPFMRSERSALDQRRRGR